MGKRHGRTNGWGTIAARAFSAAPGAVLVVALAGCSSELQDHGTPAELPAGSAAADTQTSAQAPADDADRPAFHFASGDLVLGDFNYEDIAGNIFNPCEEISAEEFAAIGFEKDEKVVRKRAEDKVACQLSDIEGKNEIYRGVFSGPATRDEAPMQAEVFSTDASELVPGVYTHGTRTVEGDMCFAAVDTERGQFAAVAGDIESSIPQEERCDEAVRILESLYSL